MSDEKFRHVRACVALLLCASMTFGMLFSAVGYARAPSSEAIFKGQVRIGTEPAPDTLIMYSIDSEGTPSGNSTVSDSMGNYEIRVEGGHMYYLYYANGGALFDSRTTIPSMISFGETKYVNATLSPAPARTATMRGFITNASNASQPVTGGHMLGLRVTLLSGGPDYINWTTPDSAGYFELKLLPGILSAAIFDAPGYFPWMMSSDPKVAAPGSTTWMNISLRPFTGYTVNITGYVRDSVTSAPIQNAAVKAYDQYGFSNTTRTNASGYYMLQFIDGSGGIDVKAADHVSQMTSVVFSGNMTRDFVLRQQNASVGGYVLDAYTGLPIPNATVRAYNTFGSDELYASTLSAQNGSYGLDLCDGTWNLDARAIWHGPCSDSILLAPSELLLHNITLIPQSSFVKGFVTDFSSGLPIEDAEVSMSGHTVGASNSTMTDWSGYFEMRCLPDEYTLMLMADGYVWEMSQAYLGVTVNETVWLNLTLDPETVELFGTVTDALTGAPIDGGVIQVFDSFSHNPGYGRIAEASISSGAYSIMFSPTDMFCYLVAARDSYQPTVLYFRVPDVARLENNISLLPNGPIPTYTLQGFVKDSTSDTAVIGADVEAMFGTAMVGGNTTNETGYYTLNLYVVSLTLVVNAAGYPDLEIPIDPGAANSTVWMNITIEHDTTPPAVSGSVVPNTSVSVYNHANMSMEIFEPHLSLGAIVVGKLENKTDFSASVTLIDQYIGIPLYGSLYGDLDGTEQAPGNWTMYLSDWNSTSQNLFSISDGTGAFEMTSAMSDDPPVSYAVSGGYVNDSLASTVWAYAFFDSDGTFLGIGSDLSLLDLGTVTDMTGRFLLNKSSVQFNLTDGSVTGSTTSSVEFVAPDMTLGGPGVTYPSGDYCAVMIAADEVNNMNFSFAMFTIDNDPPVADAGPGLTQLQGLVAMLNASASTDNGQLVNYTWVVEDGTSATLWGAEVEFTFMTVGNHTVTVTVTDAAGYSSSASTVFRILQDQPPVAAAGPDQVIDEDTAVFFDGTGSHDDVGIVNYTWTIIETSSVLYGATPDCVFATPGTYHLRLVVTDTFGQASAYDEVSVNVSDVTDPMASAGPDQMVNYGTAATFNGSGSTDNVAVTRYTWTFTDDGSPRTLSGEHPTYTFLSQGNYIVTLTVEDAAGNTGTDTVIVSVNAPPQASAGSDVQVSKGTEVTFSGSASFDDIQITNYTWSFTYEGVLQTMYGATPKFTFDEPGTYQVQLTVRDVGGLTSTDTVVVTVTGAGTTADFLNQYWWALALAAVVVVGVAVALLSRRGKGPVPTAGSGHEEEPPPPPSDELEFPPPNDEEL